MALFINGVGQDTFSMNGVAIDNLYVDGVLVWSSDTEVAVIPRYELIEALVDTSTIDDSANTLPTYNGLLTESDGTTSYEPTELQYPRNGLLELTNGRIMDTQYVRQQQDAQYGIYDADGSTTYKIWALQWVTGSNYVVWEGDQDTPLYSTGEHDLVIPEGTMKITDGRPSWLPVDVSYGPELIENGDFTAVTDLYKWTTVGGWEEVNEEAVCSATAVRQYIFQNKFVNNIGKTFKFEFDVIALSGTLKVEVSSSADQTKVDGTLQDFITISTPGHYEYELEFMVDAINNRPLFGSGEDNTTATVDNISLKEKTSAGQVDYLMYDSTLYQNKPADFGVNFVTDNALDETRFVDTGCIVNETKIRTEVQNWADTSLPFIVDVECYDDEINQEDDTAANLAIDQLVNIANIIINERGLSNPDLKFGFYGSAPIRNYWTPVNNDPTAMAEWQRRNDRLQRLVDLVDWIIPSLYTFYGPADNGNYIGDGVTYMNSNLTEAARFTGDKPIMPFLWPEYHNSNATYQCTYIDQTYWQTILNTCYNFGVNNNRNVVIDIWGGWDLCDYGAREWDDNNPWWLTTSQFITDKTGV